MKRISPNGNPGVSGRAAGLGVDVGVGVEQAASKSEPMMTEVRSNFMSW